MADADSNGVTHKYIYGKGLLAVATANTRYCYHFNGIGSTVAITDMTQAVANSYAYDPFGQVLNQQETVPQPFKYVGKYGVMAEPNGLYYMRARYYDPNVGRFISEDPIGFAGGDVNLFGYVRNNPVMGIDPYGLFGWADMPMPPQSMVDFSAGVGSVLSFGLTDVINDATGASSVVNKCSGWHTLGTVTGIVLATAIGGAGGAEAAEANAGIQGFEFSHWMPVRMGGPRSIWNGNYVSQEMHYLTDPFRYPSGWQDWGPKLNPVLQQLLRIPYVYDGAAAGAAYGGASAMAGGNCGCN